LGKGICVWPALDV